MLMSNQVEVVLQELQRGGSLGPVAIIFAVRPEERPFDHKLLLGPLISDKVS